MRIKSIAFTTDVAIIKNINADAVIAVYPFTPQPTISQAIIGISDVPVFVGVGGGITGGDRSVRLAIEAENQGAFGVVVNAPISDEVISRIKQVVDIPVIATIVSERMDIRSRIEAGADFLNVSGAAATPQIVRSIRTQFPDVPILATVSPPTPESNTPTGAVFLFIISDYILPYFSIMTQIQPCGLRRLHKAELSSCRCLIIL